MQPLTRLRLAIIREALESMLIFYAAVTLFLVGPNTPWGVSVPVAGAGAALVGLLLAAHVVALMMGYPGLKRRIRAATRG